MTPKSYITLCVIGILYVIICAVAILSPHGNSYALNQSGDSAQSDAGQGSRQDTAGSEVSAEALLLLKNDAGVEIPLSLSSMSTFAASELTVNVKGRDMTFTAASLKAVIDWSGIDINTDIIVVKDANGSAVAYRTVDLRRDGNAYIVYGMADGSPLAEQYGNFCIYLADGTHAGLMLNAAIIDFG